jgi:hypothetical protein
MEDPNSPNAPARYRNPPVEAPQEPAVEPPAESFPVLPAPEARAPNRFELQQLPPKQSFPWLMVVIMGGVGVLIASMFATFGLGGARSLLPSTPIVCGQGDSVELIGVPKENPTGVAVTAGDGCRLLIHGGTIRGKVAVRATGRATVTIKGATLEGSEAAVDADGSVEVDLTQCEVRGPVAVRGREQALIVLVMGQVQGTRLAIEAKDRTRVEVRGTVLLGETAKDPLARIVLER